MSDHDDDTLLERCRARDRQALLRVHAICAGPIIRFFKTKAKFEDREDLCQDTLKALYDALDRIERRPGFSDVRTLRAYAHGIAQKVLYGYLRKKSRMRNFDPEHTSLSTVVPSAGSVISRKREMILLLRALQDIPLSDQILLELRYFEGRRITEIAEDMCIPASTARSRMEAARKRLLKQLRSYEASPLVITSTIEHLDDWMHRIQEHLQQLDSFDPGDPDEPNPDDDPLIMSDAKLLAAWRNGDRAAGHELASRYNDKLLRFFSHKGVNDPQDLLQETFEGLLKGLERVRGDSSVRTWVFAIARYKLYNHLRDNKRDRARFEPETVSLAALATTPTAKLAAGERERHLIRALSELPLDLQIMFELHYWQDLQLKAIARIFDIGEATLRRRLLRARQALKSALERIEGDPDAEDSLENLSEWVERVEHAFAARHPNIKDPKQRPDNQDPPGP